ncbi:hypothetical protein NLI96_g2929 [Meripilus lineatus]|uniref:F-box domain-containing protein n=1 Tax=Meripilus lineatus TaxID=2056292 RepID=A0AAD5V9Z1_9APHY|nr:hypothetical protein NLI96_g2929 [Physisporinus lineatus]
MDVIAEIMEHVQDRLQLCSLMRTCRTLYSIGIPPLLRSPIKINSLQSLSSFQDFLFAEPLGSERRFGSVRCLHINTEIDSLGGDMLKTILVRTTNLQGLSILRSYSFFALCLDAGKSMENLSRLTDLTLVFIKPHNVLCLQGMKSPVSKLKFTMPFEFTEPKLFPILSQVFGNTLTELDIYGVHLSGTDAQFPRLRILKIDTRHAIPAVVLAHTFPGLKSLDIATFYPSSTYHMSTEATHQHALNKARLSSSRLPLPSLQYLKASPTDLFYNAIIPRAEEFEVVELDLINAEWLLELLKGIQPSILRLCFYHAAFSNLILVTFLQTLLEENPSITTLDLIVSCDAMDNDQTQSFIDLFPDMVKGASLKSLHLLIRQFRLDWRENSCLRTLDIMNFIAKISVKCPDTQNITVALKPINMIPGETRFTKFVDIDKEFQETGKTFRELREDLAQET